MNQEPIYLFAKWQVKEDQIETVLNLLPEIVKKSTAEEGNITYKIHRGTSETNTLMLYEAYKDESALAEHRNSEHFQTIVIGQIVPLLENREVFLATQLDL
jgi:autoinducer 2-degrading protein